MPISDPIRVVKKVTDVLDELGIRYLIGGSLASSLHGVPRATQDVDIVADFSESQIEKLNILLSNSFFIDIEMVKDAIRRRSSFNIIDKEDFFKIDFFVQKEDDLSVTEMDRRVLYHLAESDNQAIYICSPEDIIAQKLSWYRLGGGVSERQWNDALNVVKVQKGRLDGKYLHEVCRKRRVSDLLEKLLTGQND